MKAHITALLLLTAATAAAPARGQTVNLGNSPSAVAVNPVNGKAYIATPSGIVILDVANRTTTTLAMTISPTAIAVNAATNKVYVSNSNNVIVIDGATNEHTTAPAGLEGRGIAVNPATNRIYRLQRRQQDRHPVEERGDRPALHDAHERHPDHEPGPVLH